MTCPPFVRLVLAALPVLWPTLAAANTFYRCVDANGNTLYTNQKSAHKNCTVLSVMVPPAPGTRPATGTPATRTPTPADFPKVGQGEQQARDTDRRTILESELRNEQGEGGGLAGAGLGATEKVAASQDGGDGLDLDGGGGFIAVLAHSLHDGRGQVQFVECH